MQGDEGASGRPAGGLLGAVRVGRGGTDGCKGRRREAQTTGFGRGWV